MATPDNTGLTLDVVSSLDMNEVPNKLKCAICSKLALNAFKLPCCAQSICESCQSSLQESCPVCEHSPLSPDLCVPHKALRNTIKAYLKTAEKRLAEEKSRAIKAQGQAAPDAEDPAKPDPSPQETPNIKREESAQPVDVPIEVSGPAVEDDAAPATIAPDDPQPSIEQPDDPEYLRKPGQVASEEGDYALPRNGEVSEQPVRQGDEARSNSLAPDSSKPPDTFQQNGMAFGVGGNMPNGMMGMGGNMDYNPMMQMMSNGMMNGMNMNVIGMPGVGMDTMSQGMFGGFGQGMDMNQMNGMNMGFDPLGGQGMFGWNGQNNMWNGQPNGMNSNFGSNPGFGYNMNNQGNFQQNQYPYNNFQHGYRGQGYMRGRGRGRGPYGWRGQNGHGSHMHGDHSNYSQHPYQQQPQSASGNQTEYQVENGSTLTEDQMKHIDDGLAPGGQEETNEALGISSEAPAKFDTDVPEDTIMGESRTPNGADGMNGAEETTRSNPVVSTTQTADVNGVESNAVEACTKLQGTVAMPPPGAPIGPSAQFGRGNQNPGSRGRGSGRFATRGRGGFGVTPPTGPSGHGVPGAPTGPKGAPTGPKALRQDTTVSRDVPKETNDGFHIMGRASTTAKTKHDGDRSDYAESTSRYADDAEHREPNSSRHRSQSRTRSRSRTPSRHRSDRQRYHDSREASDTGYENRKSSHKHRSTKHDDGVEYKDGRRDDYESERSQKDSHHHRDKDRHRHKHRSSHRSHRRRDEEADDYTEELESSYEKRKASKDFDTESRTSSHRGHKDRDRDRERERSGRHGSNNYREDRHRDRKRSRRDRDYDDNTNDVKEHAENRDDHDHDDDYNSRHRSSRRQKREHQDYDTNPRELQTSEPPKDPHTLEREARNRERMLKEQQRREAAEKTNSKRGGESRTDHGRSYNNSHGHSGSSGRRVSYKYEDEESTVRGEREREAARWR